MKKLIVFDLDGTLAPSKSSLDPEMASLLHDLLSVARVAVISGGAWLQFEKQVLSHLPQDERLTRLSILPTCGTQFFQYVGEWKRLYAEDFTADEKEKIVSSLNKAVETAGFAVEKTWGETIEDRGSQMTYSALGQQAPLEEKVSGMLILPSGRRSRQFSTLSFPSFRSASAARHPSTLPSLALTRHTASGSCVTFSGSRCKR